MCGENELFTRGCRYFLYVSLFPATNPRLHATSTMPALISYCKLDILLPPFSKKRRQIRGRQKTKGRIQRPPKTNSSAGFSKELHIYHSLVNVLTPVLKWSWNLKHEEHYTQWYVRIWENLPCHGNYLTAAMLCWAFENQCNILITYYNGPSFHLNIMQNFNHISRTSATENTDECALPSTTSVLQI